MSSDTALQTPVAPTEDVAAADQGTESLQTEELLVEEVSIDGMCGVY